MPYAIHLTNGTLKTTVADGTTDVSSTSIALVGKNFPGYGEYINENFVKMLENFSNATQPGVPLTGQLWYNSTSKVMLVWDGTAWVAAGKSITLDQTSSALHYMTVVASETGAPDLKTTKDKGITVQPSTGKIGVNTSQVPTAYFTVNGSSDRARALPSAAYTGTIGSFYGADSSYAILSIDAFGDAFTLPGWWMRKARGTSASLTAVQSEDPLGAIAAGGSTGANTYAQLPSAGVMFMATQAYTATNNGSRIDFYTTPNNANVWVKAASIGQNRDFTANGDVIAYGLSDERVKENIVTIDHALEKVLQLDGVTFNWRPEANKETEQREPGVIAQQVQQVLPEAVLTRGDGHLGVRYEKLIPLLVEAIKDLQKEIISIKTKLA